MSNILNLKGVKFFAIIVLAVAMLATFGMVAVQQADAAYVHTVTLKQGSSGPQVVSLQQTLGITADGSFGPMTKAAVVAFQASKNLTADGVVGPATGAALAGVASSGGSFLPGCTSTAGYSSTTGIKCDSGSALPAGCTSTAGYSSTTGVKCDSTSGSSSGGLTGGAGDLESADFVSSINNEEVGEDESDVEILGLELEADNGSDLEFTSVRIEFAQNDPECSASSCSGSDDINDYADEVSIWLDGKEVGSADLSDFDEDDDVYSDTVSLNGAVVKAGKTGDLVVAVSGASNIDSDDLADNAFNATVVNLRYQDAQGAIVTENDLNDIGTEDRNFTFASFAAAADVELVVDEDNAEDEINEDHTVDVDEDDETEDEPILAFTLEAEGDSDIVVTEIPVMFTTNDSNLSTVISSVSLFQGDDEVATEDVDGTSSSESITFEDFEIEISAGDEESFTVKANILETDSGTNYTSGTATLVAELGSTEVDAIEAEDESGEDLGSGELTGTATGGTLTLSTSAVVVDVTGKSVTTSSTDSDDAYEEAAYTFTINIAADGDEDVTFDADDDIAYTILGGSDTTATSINFYKLSGDATDNGSNSFTIGEGDDATFSFTVTHNPDSGGNYRVRLDTVVGQDMPDNEYSDEKTLVAS